MSMLPISQLGGKPPSLTCVQTTILAEAVNYYTVFPAVAGRVIDVHGFLITSTGDTYLQFRSGAPGDEPGQTELSLEHVVTLGHVFHALREFGSLWSTVRGEGLVLKRLNQAAVIQVEIWGRYV
jgi:hypothetical protein